MLFAQIIAFVLVMVVFEAHQPGRPSLGWWESLALLPAALAWLWLGAKIAAGSLLGRLKGSRPPADPARAVRRLELYLQGAAFLLYLALVVPGEFKAQLMRLPWVAASETLAGLCAVGLYLLFLLTAWNGVHPLERAVFGLREGRFAFLGGRVRLVSPVIFPWLLVSLARDLLVLAWPAAAGLLRTELGDLVFLAVFLVVVAWLFPPLVRWWWGLRPWPADAAREVCELVFARAGVKVSQVLAWTVLEGRLLTAGVLGLFPGARYLLLTPGLVAALNPLELAGVAAHEAGHLHFRHIAAYLGLFMGFFVAAAALAGPLDLLAAWVVKVLSGWPAGARWLSDPAGGGEWLSLMAGLPLALVMLVYLRWGLGFFMRHFERQADLYALALLGEAGPLAQALEKVAARSGNIRDLPSWHHFSIAQRVGVLEAAAGDPPAALAAQGRRLRRATLVYLAAIVVVAGLGFGLAEADLSAGLRRETAINLLAPRLAERPDDPRLLLGLGELNFEQGRERLALEQLMRAVELMPRNPQALNGLAWALVTARDESLRRPREGLELAQRAVGLSPAPHIWDTLAEAYFVNGRADLALAAINAALAAGPQDRLAYYQAQRERFARAAQAR